MSKGGLQRLPCYLTLSKLQEASLSCFLSQDLDATVLAKWGATRVPGPFSSAWEKLLIKWLEMTQHTLMGLRLKRPMGSFRPLWAPLFTRHMLKCTMSYIRYDEDITSDIWLSKSWTNCHWLLHSICQQVWKTQQWPQDWKRSVFIPIPKKGNPKECSNYHTTALISHASNVQNSPSQDSAICEPRTSRCASWF